MQQECSKFPLESGLADLSALNPVIERAACRASRHHLAEPTARKAETPPSPPWPRSHPATKRRIADGKPPADDARRIEELRAASARPVTGWLKRPEEPR